MSPRAAWRLESLGFREVYEYKAGKLDWMAAGLPTEGTNALHPRAGDAARKDVPVCSLHERLVLGLLRSKELAKDADMTIEQAMRPGPSTFRPYVSIKEMADFMVQHNV